MLRFFRGGGISQVLVGGIAFAIIMVFALEFRAGSGSATGKLTTECAVKYAGYCVDPKEYYAAFGLIVPRNVEPKQIREAGLRQKVLDGLIERELLVAEAKRLGLGISEDAVNAELEEGRAHVSLPAEIAPQLSPQLGLCPASYTPQGPMCQPGSDYPVRLLPVKRPNEPFDYKLYERQVRITTNRGPREFKEMQQRELIANRLRDLVRQRVRVPEAEAFLLYERDRTRAVIRSAELDRDWFAKYVVDYSDASVEKWTSEHLAQVDPAWESAKANFEANCPLVSEILVQLPSAATDDEKVELRKRIDEAHARVKGGESFEDVAREVSEGEAALFGGDLGCLSKAYGVGSDELSAAASKLEAGQISSVIETPRGLHVLRSNGRLKAEDVEKFGRRQVARRLYARAAADEALAKFGEELITRAKGGQKLEDAVAELSKAYVERNAKPVPGARKAEEPKALSAPDRPRFSVSPPFNVSGNPLPSVDPKEPLAARAFELKEPDEVYKTPIATSEGAVVLQLKEKTAAKREDFEKERPTIMRALQQAKAADALVRYVADLRRAAGDKLKIERRFAEEPKQGTE